MFWFTLGTESLAMMRFLQSLHYLASNARLRFLSFYACHVKYSFRIVVGKFRFQSPTAPWYHSDAAPLSFDYFKDFGQ